ncbi:MAG: HAMP domain-containing histidine kinase, partial [Flavisolibacter sp.]|nr:HAMP domain-containing histidine kinase [Flavisolibacter sp.]
MVRIKRIFPIIIVLIGLSLIGIIYIQYSWLHSMLLLKQDQLKEKFQKVTESLATDLEKYRGASKPSTRSNSFLEESSPDDFFKFYSVSDRLTTQEINEKIRLAFIANNMKEVPFEFALIVLKPGEHSYTARRSQNFEEWYYDTINHTSIATPLASRPGSESENLVPDELLMIIIPATKTLVFKDMTYLIIAAIAFTVIILSAFYLTVNTMIRQKKLSEIKNDFINNMTHEFKTPIATISLAVDAIRNEKVQRDTAKLGYFSSIIKEENQRMNRQVETILKSALMDRQEVQLNLKPLHVHEIIRDVADNFILRLQEKQGMLETDLSAT